jgi:hypothetical protein
MDLPVNPTEAEKEARILKMLVDLEAVYGMRELTEAEKAARFRQYLDDLRPYTLGEVAKGIAGYRKSVAAWYPTPGQIIAHIPHYEPPRNDEEFRQRILSWHTICQETPGVAPERCWPESWGGTGPGTDPRHPKAIVEAFGMVLSAERTAKRIGR